MLSEVEGTEAGSFRTEDGAAPSCALAGQYAGVVFAGELLVHAVHVADFTAAYANVASRDVGVRADCAPKFIHESLAETHDFSV